MFLCHDPIILYLFFLSDFGVFFPGNYGENRVIIFHCPEFGVMMHVYWEFRGWGICLILVVFGVFVS